jgi:drug/metabolite transporter (DMT)-like permease
MLWRSNAPHLLAMTAPSSRPTLLPLCFAAVYLIWGSAFAASKLVVHDLPPLLAGAIRFLVAGAGLAAVASWRGARIPRVAREWQHFAVMGLLLIVLSSGINALAIRFVASNESALLNVSSALWIPLLGTLGARGHRLTARAAAGLLLGFAGVAFLMWPKSGFSLTNLGWKLAIVGACFAWALGPLYYRRIVSSTPPLMFTALEMVLGGVMLTVVALANDDPAHWHPTWPSLAGLVFLTIFSSGVAYTAFGYLMRHTTPARLGTYAYVNPVVAALVGWALLGEELSGVQLLGTAIILTGVVLVSLPDARAEPRALGAPPAESTP